MYTHQLRQCAFRVWALTIIALTIVSFLSCIISFSSLLGLYYQYASCYFSCLKKKKKSNKVEHRPSLNTQSSPVSWLYIPSPMLMSSRSS